MCILARCELPVLSLLQPRAGPQAATRVSGNSDRNSFFSAPLSPAGAPHRTQTIKILEEGTRNVS